MKIRKSSGFTLVEIMVVVAIIGLVTATAVPNYIKSHRTAQRNVCIANLQQLSEAKDIFAMNENLKVEAPVSILLNLIPDYIKAEPECPVCGVYAIGSVGGPTQCTHNGSAISYPEDAGTAGDEDEEDYTFTYTMTMYMCSGCFAEDTPVITSKGIKPLSEIKVGDMVLGKDGFRKVLAVSHDNLNPEISINGIEATFDHPFVMENGELKEAQDLKVGDILFNGIEVKTARKISSQKKVCDLLVEGNTFYVRDILIHNILKKNE